MNEQSRSEQQAELDALRQRLGDLEAKYRDSLSRPSRTRRPVFSRKFLLGALPVALLLAAGGLLYGQGAGDALFIDPKGWVGIGTVPKATLDVAGKLNVSDSATVVNKTETGSLEAGTLKVAKDANLANTTIKGSLTTTEGNVGIGATTIHNPQGWNKVVDILGTSNARLNVRSGVGVVTSVFSHDNWNGARGIIGTDSNHPLTFATNYTHRMTIDTAGNVGIGTTSPDPKAKLDVNGDVRIQGKVSSRGRYQRDDQAEATYEIPPRYHLSLTAPAYAGRTKTIPMEVLEGLCGKQDGCKVRIGITRWDNDNTPETYSRDFLFYYHISTRRWRTSTDVTGQVGDSAWTDAYQWGYCYFTERTFTSYSGPGTDLGTGMQLLLWNQNGGPNRTCELTLLP